MTTFQIVNSAGALDCTSDLYRPTWTTRGYDAAEFESHARATAVQYALACKLPDWGDSVGAAMVSAAHIVRKEYNTAEPSDVHPPMQRLRRTAEWCVFLFVDGSPLPVRAKVEVPV